MKKYPKACIFHILECEEIFFGDSTLKKFIREGVPGMQTRTANTFGELNWTRLEDDYLRSFYTRDGVDGFLLVRLVRQKVGFGVTTYFHCPGLPDHPCLSKSTGKPRRAYKLYRPPDSISFACAKCHRITTKELYEKLPLKTAYDTGRLARHVASIYDPSKGLKAAHAAVMVQLEEGMALMRLEQYDELIKRLGILRREVRALKRDQKKALERRKIQARAEVQEIRALEIAHSHAG